MRCFFQLLFVVFFCMFSSIAYANSASSLNSMEKFSQIKAVRMSVSTEKIRIVVDSDAPLSSKVMFLKAPERLVVDIPHARLVKDIKRKQAISSTLASKWRIAQFTPATVRLVIETPLKKEQIKVFSLNNVGKIPGRIVVDLGVSDMARENSSHETAPANPTQETSDKKESHKEPVKSGGEADSEVDEWAKEQFPDLSETEGGASNKQDTDEDINNMTGLKGKKITIDPGHGGIDSGAIGPTGVMEKSIALRVANELKALLEAEGATVYMTRTRDVEVAPKGAKATDIEELQARCDIANKNGSDVFVSIHMDSFTNGTTKGTTGYYYALGSKRSRSLADKVRRGVVEQLATQSRGTQSSNFYVLKHTDMPATLIEMAFISNKDEEKLMDQAEGIHKAAQGIADGIADFFG